MDLKDKIVQQFNKHPHLRVLFFFDPEAEMKEEIEAMTISDVRVVKYDNQPLNTKVKLHREWAADKVFLYFNIASPSTQDEMKNFPLLGTLIANKELRLGDVSDFIELYGLKTQHQALVNNYINELKYDKVQQSLKPLLNKDAFTKENLERGLISYHLKFNEPQPWEFVIGRLFTWTDAKYSADIIKALKKIKDLKLEEKVTSRLADLFDEPVNVLSQQVLNNLVKKLKYNMVLQQLDTAPHDPYATLKIKHGGSFNRLTMFWEQLKNHPKLGAEFIRVITEQGREIKEEIILQHYGTDAAYGWLPNDLKWLIVNEYLKQIPAQPGIMLSALEKFGLHVEENKSIRNMVAGASHAANCLQMIKEVITYTLNKPEDYIHRYIDNDYKIDQSYRKAVSKLSAEAIDDMPSFVALDPLKDALNRQYDTWLEKWNREWLKCLETKQFSFADLAITKQYEFFKKEVAPYDQKLVVFISDALRFEAGIELLNEMHNDRKSEAVMRHLLASVPSKTSIGMSNLLPGNIRKFNDDQVTIDGLQTASTNRTAVLQKASPGAVAVSYDQVQKNNQDQNRELFKAPLVYIYHNVIDATGDATKSERRTFKAVEEAIGEIKQLVKRIHSAFNVARVLITADHGFLYNDRSIAEADKEDLPISSPVIAHNRFVITQSEEKSALGYCFPLKATTLFDDNRWVVIPASINRYKRQGSGQQYVHGGASLQELIVPVIESARSREDISRKVGVKLISGNLRIVSNILKVDFVQENIVSRHEKGRRIKVGIYNGYDLVSNEEEIPVESTSELPSERVFTVQLKLKAMTTLGAAMVLKVFDAEDLYNPIIEQPVINNTLIQSDF